MNPAEVSAIKREIQESLHCALPGFVEAFDSEKGTVSVRPALRMRDGEREMWLCVNEGEDGDPTRG